jgi:DNA-binding GntR family transcriptional regulator
MKEGFKGINSAILRDQVSTAIIEALSRGELRPGDQVNEAEIARQAGISRGPVREAIQQLVGEEILVSHPHRGTFVAEWNEKDIIEVYGVRALLESYAAGLAAQTMKSENFEELSEIVNNMIKAAHEGDATKVFNLDLKFHHRSYELSCNELLCRLLERLGKKITLYVRLDADTTPDLVRYAENHLILINAMKSRDPKGTEKVFRDHILEVGQMMADRFSQNQSSQVN